jgi:glycosyltransferase involved in cell wall biosynthesis
MPTVKVAVVTQDVIGERLAGPAIRALAMGRALQREGHEVRVHSADAATSPLDIVVPGGLSAAAATTTARWADVVVVQGDVLDARPGLGRGDGALVCDLYDPFELEGLVRGVHLPVAARYAATRRALSVLSGQLSRGDLFLCASERQRLVWLGHLDAAGRINPATHDADPALADLIAVVPFGIEDEPPTRDGPGLRDEVEGLDERSRILLWGGGIYDWLDPIPLINAVADLTSEIPDLRLVFMGTAHPNPAVRPPAMLAEARRLAAARRADHAVLFHDGWVPYEARHNVLLDAEIGVSGHLPHVETLLAYRTRILDYIWAGLPVVTTEGDALGDLVAAEGLGAVVPPSDPEAVAAALRSLLLEPAQAAEARRNVQAVAPSMRWSAALRPFLDFCAAPRPAADRDGAEAVRLRLDRAPGRSERRARARDLATSARRVLRDEGPAGVASKAIEKARGTARRGRAR